MYERRERKIQQCKIYKQKIFKNNMQKWINCYNTTECYDFLSKLAGFADDDVVYIRKQWH